MDMSKMRCPFLLPKWLLKGKNGHHIGRSQNEVPCSILESNILGTQSAPYLYLLKDTMGLFILDIYPFDVFWARNFGAKEPPQNLNATFPLKAPHRSILVDPVVKFQFVPFELAATPDPKYTPHWNHLEPPYF